MSYLWSRFLASAIANRCYSNHVMADSETNNAANGERLSERYGLHCNGLGKRTEKNRWFYFIQIRNSQKCWYFWIEIAFGGWRWAYLNHKWAQHIQSRSLFGKHERIVGNSLTDFWIWILMFWRHWGEQYCCEFNLFQWKYAKYPLAGGSNDAVWLHNPLSYIAFTIISAYNLSDWFVLYSNWPSAG